MNAYPRPALLVSTCGTSLLTNGASESSRSLLSETANKTKDELEPSPLRDISGQLNARRQALQAAGLAEVKRLSAELNGVLAYYGGVLPSGPGRDQHILLHTDTFQGTAVAEILEGWLQSQGFAVSKQSFDGFSTRSVEDFQRAMSDLVGWAHETLPDYRSKGWEVIFNLTGGFKSANGFLQAVGMFYADRVVYLFESSSELITIPRLPLALGADQAVEQSFETFRRLARHGELLLSACGTIPETMLFVFEGKASLSAWGELLWLQTKPQFYDRELLPPLTQKLIFSEAFRRDVRELPPDRVSIVNHRLDDLAKYLESDGQSCPKSLTFKKIQGKPREGSTHECYAWSDGDARRIFCHFDGDILILDNLGKHL